MTDELPLYGGDVVAGMPHGAVEHGKGIYAGGRVHSNTVEPGSAGEGTPGTLA